MSENEQAGDHAGHYLIPSRYYGYNFAVIAVLMSLTVLAAKWDVMDFHAVNGVNLWIALGIAIAKAGCIMAIFMGVKWSTPLVKMFALCAVAWLMILFTFFLVDYASPSWGLGTPYQDYENPGQKPLP